MRRTKHRRRFHTDRVIRSRQRRWRRESASWDLDSRDPLPDGRLKHTNAYWDRGTPRCGLCHGEKFDRARRDRERRRWRREVEIELAELGLVALRR